MSDDGFIAFVIIALLSNWGISLLKKGWKTDKLNLVIAGLGILYLVYKNLAIT